MNRVDVFFVIGKGSEKQELTDLRLGLLTEHVTRPHRVVDIVDPPRDRTPPDYEAVVDDWHERRAAIFEAEFADTPEDVAAILVWGDPALYDSTIRIVERVLARGAVSFDWSVIPGVTSVHALAAAHRTVLHRVGEPVHITTGRRLAGGLPEGVDNAVVMLDARCTFTQIPGDDVHIWWGAYLGTPDEVLITGNLREVEADIVRVRAELRERKGWIMDTYLLRRG